MKYVYFIKPIGMDGPVKIGVSSVPSERLLNLSVWSPFPLEIIGAVPGSYEDEQFLHRCFASSHSHREWFKATPLLLGCIRAVLAAGTIAAVKDKIEPVGTIKNGSRKERPPEYRRFLSYSHRVRHACAKLRRADENGLWDTPEDVRRIMVRWNSGHYRNRTIQPPTGDELARVEEYLADPAAHSVAPYWRRERAA